MKQLKYQMPPCPCERCKEERVKKLLNQQNDGDCSNVETSPEGGSPEMKSEIKCESCDNCEECDCGVGCCNTGFNFVSFIMEAVGLVTYLILACVVFWLVVGQYAILLGVKLYNSPRSVQIYTVGIIGIVLLAVLGSHVYDSVKNYQQRRYTEPKMKYEKPPCPNKSSSGKPCPKKMNVTVAPYDEKARAVYKQSKLYAIPTEMKEPPAILVYLRDVVLRHI